MLLCEIAARLEASQIVGVQTLESYQAKGAWTLESSSPQMLLDSILDE